MAAVPHATPREQTGAGAMVCYGPRVGTIAVAGAVGYVFLHRVIGQILHIAGLVLEVALITCVAAAAAVLLAWTVRTVQRRARRGRRVHDLLVPLPAAADPAG